MQSKQRKSFTSHGQAGDQPFRVKQGSIMPYGDLGRHTLSLWISPSSFSLPQLYMLSMIPYGMEYPLGQSDSAVPAASPHNSLCTPLVGQSEEQKRPWLCKPSSAAAQTELHYGPVVGVASTNPKQPKPVLLWRKCCEENLLYPSQNQHKCTDGKCHPRMFLMILVCILSLFFWLMWIVGMPSFPPVFLYVT